jgi:hypothetical protein
MDKNFGFNKCIIVTMILFSFCTTLFAQPQKKLSLGDLPLFTVNKAKSPVKIDGKMNDEDWKKTMTRSLDYFYRIEKSSDQQNTTFRMLWDEDNLYVFFQCKDKYLTAREKARDGVPYLDDCAEVFFVPAPDSLDVHFGFEINLNKASNDFIWLNDFYKGKSGLIKSYNPEFKVEVSVLGTINDNSDIDEGWTMEMAIPLTLFAGVDLLFPVTTGTRWAFQAARQDRNDTTGDRRSTSTIFPVYDISKSVHQPNRFGLLEFVE